MCRIVAHRGQQATYPENTLESLQQAIDCGAKAVEFDVQMTLDHIPVVCHDINLLRTANNNIDISQSRYEEIRDINVGEAERFADQFSLVTLPSLKNIIELLRKNSDVLAFVELKDESINAFGVETYVNQVLSCVESVQAQCVIIADSLSAITYIKENTSIPVGWIIHRWQVEDFEKAKHLKLDYLVINHKYISEDKYDFTIDDWQWVVYETRNPDKAVRLFEQGVAFVETDDVCQMLKRLPGYK